MLPTDLHGPRTEGVFFPGFVDYLLILSSPHRLPLVTPHRSLTVVLGTLHLFGSYRRISPLAPWDRDDGVEGITLTESLSSLKGNVPFPFVFRGWQGVTVGSVDVRNDILLGCQEGSRLGSNPSTDLKCVDIMRSHVHVQHVKDKEYWFRRRHVTVEL